MQNRSFSKFLAHFWPKYLLRTYFPQWVSYFKRSWTVLLSTPIYWVGALCPVLSLHIQIKWSYILFRQFLIRFYIFFYDTWKNRTFFLKEEPLWLTSWVINANFPSSTTPLKFRLKKNEYSTLYFIPIILWGDISRF